MDFKKACAAACKAGHVPGRRFHDLRRTAARNMVRAGVTETVAMSLTGHRTRAMFDRYNITSQEDQRDALKQLAAYVSALPAHDEKIAEHSPREEAAS